jgi:hypothetical protein
VSCGAQQSPGSWLPSSCGETWDCRRLVPLQRSEPAAPCCCSSAAWRLWQRRVAGLHGKASRRRREGGVLGAHCNMWCCSVFISIGGRLVWCCVGGQGPCLRRQQPTSLRLGSYAALVAGVMKLQEKSFGRPRSSTASAAASGAAPLLEGVAGDLPLHLAAECSG